jgi:hypothetical protein
MPFVGASDGYIANACNVICYASGHIASTPRLAERCGLLKCRCFPSRHAREKRASGVRSVPQIDWTPFFGGTVFTPPRFFAAGEMQRASARAHAACGPSPLSLCWSPHGNSLSEKEAAPKDGHSTHSMPFMTASVVAEGRDNAIYHTVCNNSKDETLPKNHRPFRKTIGQLCDNSQSISPLRHSKPTFRQAGA